MALKKPYKSTVQSPEMDHLIALNIGGNLRKLQNVVIIKSLVVDTTKPVSPDDRWLVKVMPTELVDAELLAPEIKGTLVIYDKEVLGPTVDSPITKKALDAVNKKARK